MSELPTNKPFDYGVEVAVCFEAIIDRLTLNEFTRSERQAVIAGAMSSAKDIVIARHQTEWNITGMNRCERKGRE